MAARASDSEPAPSPGGSADAPDSLGATVGTAALPRVPRLGRARGVVWIGIAGVLALGVGGPAAPASWQLRWSDTGCVVLPSMQTAGTAAALAGAACPCERWPSQLRRVLGLPLSLDRANVADLELLPGIGPTRAQRIVRDREQRGAFASVAALTRVDGIGETTASRLASSLFVGDADPACDQDFESLVAERVHGIEPRGSSRRP